uniref:PAP2_C domain-containing protein n=1 Tax=Panagrellus redivivus TaxID=6233 RepID=A0A7E4VJG6_PANRE
MAPFEGRGTTITTQRATSSSSSATSNDDSEESSYIDSLEEGRMPLLDNDYVADGCPNYSDDFDSNDKLKTGYTNRPNFANNAHRLPAERHKAILALILLFTAGFCNDLVLSFIHDKVPEQPPLPDIVFSNTPYIPQALTISEYLMLSSFGVLILLTFLHRHRWIVLRRIATIGSLLYFGRCITMMVTQVPVADPNYYCAPKFNESQRTFANIALRALKIVSGAGLKINGKHTLCGDYIYSGHTVVLVTCYLFIREYSPRNWKILHFASAIASFTGVVLLLISRGHYTVDVIISYWICTRVFWQYHTMAGIAVLRENRSPHNHLSKVFWFPLFKYMEYNALRPVPPRYGLPFSYLDCKKWLKSRVLKFNNN